MNSILIILIAAIAIATSLNVIFKRFNLPTVIGYIVTGVIIGTIFGIDLHSAEELEHIAEFGIVFLMFTIGLEFSVSHLNSMKREVFGYGASQVLITGLTISLISILLLNMEMRTALIVGLGLALSSTAIVLKILNETGQINSPYGRNSVGVLVFQDIAVIPILLMITIFTNEDEPVAQLLLDTAINAAIALACLVVVGRLFLARVFKLVSDTGSKEMYMGLILLVVLGSSNFAHAFGFSYSLGAFIAGMMIADTLYKYQVEADLIPFRDLLLGVFFVSIGLQMDIEVMLRYFPTILLLCAGIMVVKAVLAYLILLIGNNKKTALRSAITLSEVGEFSLVVLSLLISSELADESQMLILMSSVVLSMIATPFIINNLDKLVGLLIRDALEDELTEKSPLLSGHVLLFGFAPFGRAVSMGLDKAGINQVIVTDNSEEYLAAREENRSVTFGNPTDRSLLQRLKVEDAMSAIITVADTEQVKRISAALNLLDPDVKIIAKVSSDEEKQELADFNHEILLDGNTHLASLIVAQIAHSINLAEQTSGLKYLHNLEEADATEAIIRLVKEQSRLLEFISRYFNALRAGKDIMALKAYHDSFQTLEELISEAVLKISKRSEITAEQYEKISAIMDNQEALIRLDRVLESLGRELRILSEDDRTDGLARIAVEGLDSILLVLYDIAIDIESEDLDILRTMTTEDGGLARIRKRYLEVDTALAGEVKTALLSSTKHMEELKSLFGKIGKNYEIFAS